MDFISLKFLAVFCLIFILYWLIPNKCKNIFLLVISYLLYMMWKPTFAMVLLLITVITYFGAQIIKKIGNDKKRKHSVVLLTIISLSPLILFKYSGFISENIARAFSSLNYSIKIPSLDWAVPVGISFFTFQAVGYLLDVYHKRCEVESNIVTYSLFVSFFPQITSGPISTADELMPQFHSDRKFKYSQAVSGLRCILFGVFLKTVIADRAGIYVDMVFANINKFSGLNCFITSVIYSIQIYTDFFGYSLIAVGIAKLLGFDLINNFNRPYFAESITDFWRRWHISLSRWLKMP